MKGIDLIVGGHSHTVIMDPVVESGTVIVQAGSMDAISDVMKIALDPETQKDRHLYQQHELDGCFPPSGSPPIPK